jgi:type IV secretory pathway VirB10-like protein
MGKLTDRLKAKHADRSGRNRHRVNFLAHKADIAEAIREGWSVMQIWQQMQEDGQITMSYSAFCTHVRREIPSESRIANVKARPAAPAASEKPPAKPAPRTKPEVAFEKLPEAERLERLKQEAFASSRSPKPTGSLIVKPKTREEEYEELFGKPPPPVPDR